MPTSSWEKSIRLGTNTSFGDIVRCGTILIVYGSNGEECYLYAMDLDGNKVWTANCATATSEVRGRGVAADSQNIVVAGSVLGEWYEGRQILVPSVSVFSASTGNLIYTRTFPSSLIDVAGFECYVQGFDSADIAADGTIWLTGVAWLKKNGTFIDWKKCQLPVIVRIFPDGETSVDMFGELKPHSYRPKSIRSTGDGCVVTGEYCTGDITFGLSEPEMFVWRFVALPHFPNSPSHISPRWLRTFRLPGPLTHPLGGPRSLAGRDALCCPNNEEVIVVGQGSRNKGARVNTTGYVLKLSGDGSVVWDFEIDHERPDTWCTETELTRAEWATDGSVLLLGQTIAEKIGSKGMRILVTKLLATSSPTGERASTAWEQRLGTMEKHMRCGGIVAASDGGVYCAGTQKVNETWDAGYIARLETDGKVGEIEAKHPAGRSSFHRGRNRRSPGTVVFTDPSSATPDALKSLPDGTYAVMGQPGTSAYTTGLIFQGQFIFGTIVKEPTGKEYFHPGLFSGSSFVPGMLIESQGHLGFMPGIWEGDHFTPGLASLPSFGAPLNAGFTPGVLVPAKDPNALADWLPKIGNARAAVLDPVAERAFVPGAIREGRFEPGNFRPGFTPSRLNKTGLAVRQPQVNPADSPTWGLNAKDEGETTSPSSSGPESGWNTVMAAIGGGICGIAAFISSGGNISVAADVAAFCSIGGVLVGSAMDEWLSSTDSTPGSSEERNIACVVRQEYEYIKKPDGTLEVKSSQTVSGNCTDNSGNQGPSIEMTSEPNKMSITVGGETTTIENKKVDRPPSSGTDKFPADGPDGTNPSGAETSSMPPALLELVARYSSETKGFTVPLNTVAFYSPDSPSGGSGSGHTVSGNSGNVDPSGTGEHGGGSFSGIPDPGTVDPVGIRTQTEPAVEVTLATGEVIRISIGFDSRKPGDVIAAPHSQRRS